LMATAYFNLTNVTPHVPVHHYVMRSSICIKGAGLVRSCRFLCVRTFSASLRCPHVRPLIHSNPFQQAASVCPSDSSPSHLQRPDAAYSVHLGAERGGLYDMHLQNIKAQATLIKLSNSPSLAMHRDLNSSDCALSLCLWRSIYTGNLSASNDIYDRYYVSSLSTMHYADVDSPPCRCEQVRWSDTHTVQSMGPPTRGSHPLQTQTVCGCRNFHSRCHGR
jgi:hypothetical protein